MARRKFVCGNWKMHKTVAEALALVRELRGRARRRRRAWRWRSRRPSRRSTPWPRPSRARRSRSPRRTSTGRRRAPSPARSRRRCSPTSAAGTASSATPSGASSSARPTRRCARKVGALLAADVLPIVCVGETLAEREARPHPRGRRAAGPRRARRRPGVRRSPPSPSPTSRCGRSAPGKTATAAQAQEVHAAIRKILRELARRRGRRDPDPVRRLGEARQRRGAHVPAGRRRRARRRGQPQGGGLHRHRERCTPLITLVTVVHVVVCVFLILVILLQAGKGGGMGAAFGGAGAQTVFGGRGAQTFLGKMTAGAAAVFMLTSLSLAYQASRSGSEIEREATAPAPFPAPAAPVPAAPAGAAPGQAPAAPRRRPRRQAGRAGAAPRRAACRNGEGDPAAPDPLLFRLECPGRDSNSHALRRHPLKMVCLPVPPPGLFVKRGRVLAKARRARKRAARPSSRAQAPSRRLRLSSLSFHSSASGSGSFLSVMFGHLVQRSLLSCHVLGPLRGQALLREDRLRRAHGLAGAAVDALVGVDDEEVRPLVEAVDRAHLDAVGVLALDARLGDDVGHGGSSPAGMLRRPAGRKSRACSVHFP